MALPRTFVSFSSTDIRSYRTMQMWKANENIDFNFADFQLDESINSQHPYYITSACRKKIIRSDTFILLIGTDTWTKTAFVQADVEVAIEKECRLIAVNLDNYTRLNPLTCPAFIAKAGAVFTSFSPHIVQWALEKWERPNPRLHEWYYFKDPVYKRLGYTLNGYTAARPPQPNPFTSGRPP
jgi:hypothetical protein